MAAALESRRIKRDLAMDNISALRIEPVIVPTKKEALMAWLNANFTSDNG